MPTITYANIGKPAILPTLQDLFRYGEPGVAYDAFDLSSLFQDTAGTIPATVAGQQIALVLDRIHSTNAIQSSVALRPLLGRAPKRGVVNIIPNSNNLVPWLKTVAGISVLPKQQVGGAVADVLVEASGAGGNFFGATELTGHFIRSGNIPSGGEYQITVVAKSKELSELAIGILWTSGAVNGSVRVVNLATKTSGNEITRGGNVFAGAASFADEPDGFVKVTLAVSIAWLSPASTFIIGTAKNGVINYSGDGLSGVYIKEVQVERGNAATATQTVGGTLADVTEAGVPSYHSARLDLSDDWFDTVLPQAVTGDVVIAGRNGTVIVPASYAAGATFRLGPTSYTGGVPGILRAVGDVVGWMMVGRTLTEAERKWLLGYYKERGAKGLLVPGPELVVNGDFSGGTTGWTGNANSTLSVSDGVMTVSGSVGTVTAYQTIPVTQGRAYRIDGRLRKDTAATAAISLLNNIGSGMLYAEILYSASVLEEKSLCFISSITGSMFLNLRVPGGGTGAFEADAVSVKELRPEEDW